MLLPISAPGYLPSSVSSSQMAPGYAVAVMGIDFTLRYFYKVLLDLLPICNQDKGNKIRWVDYGLGGNLHAVFSSSCVHCSFFLLSFTITSEQMLQCLLFCASVNSQEKKNEKTQE